MLLAEFYRLFFAVCYINVALFVIPSGDLVTPPQLARDAPVPDVVQPLVVGVDPVLGVEPDLARTHAFQRLLGDALAAVAGLAHCDEPLVGQHRLDHHAGAVAARHLQFVFVRLDEQAGGFEVGADLFARGEAIHARYCLGACSLIFASNVRMEIISSL